MKINELAKLTGLTVRTLHYYDEIGLLKPSEITKSGYRLYDEDALETLQQIMFFKELEFPLKEIKRIMKDENYNKEEALNRHWKLLVEKRNRLNRLIQLANSRRKGEKNMSFKEFDMSEIEEAKKKYAKEAVERFGHTDAYKESQRRTDGYGKEQWAVIQEESDKIFREFAECKKGTPDSEQAQSLVKRWQDHITIHFYQCSDEILSGLGQMYVNDKRFTENMDKYEEGTAEFISEAIAIYCENRKGIEL